jgi:hypothetical protein
LRGEPMHLAAYIRGLGKEFEKPIVGGYYDTSTGSQFVPAGFTYTLANGYVALPSRICSAAAADYRAAFSRGR